MGIVFRQSVKSSIVIFVGALLGMLIIYLSTQLIPKAEFGFLRYFTSQAVVASQVTMLGMNIVLAIYIHRFEADDPKKPVVITLSLLIPVVVTALLSLFYFLLKPQVLQWYHVAEDRANIDAFYAWLPLFTLFWSLLLLLEHYLNSQLKVAISVMMREVVLRILNIGVIVAYAFGAIGFEGLVIGSVLIYVVPIGLLWFFCSKTTGFKLSFNWKLLSRKEHLELLHFAWYHMLMGISLNLLGYLDSLMLGPLDKKGMGSVAEYAVAVYIMTFIQIPYRAMATAALPDLTKSYESGEMTKVKDFFQRAAINTLIAAIGMSLLILLNMNNAVLVLQKGYENISWIVAILVVGRLADMATGLNNEMISISKHYKFNFYISIVLVGLIFVFNWFLIPQYGVFGAAWGTSLALIFFNGAKLIFLWNKMKLQPFSSGSWKVLVAGLCAGALGYWLPFVLNPILDAFVRSTLVLAIYTLLLVFMRPSSDLNHFLANVKANKRLF